jgi:hypothetical protein
MVADRYPVVRLVGIQRIPYVRSTSEYPFSRAYVLSPAFTPSHRHDRHVYGRRPVSPCGASRPFSARSTQYLFFFPLSSAFTASRPSRPFPRHVRHEPHLVTGLTSSLAPPRHGLSSFRHIELENREILVLDFLFPDADQLDVVALVLHFDSSLFVHAEVEQHHFRLIG